VRDVAGVSLRQHEIYWIKGVVHRQDSEGGTSTDVLIANELSKGIGSTLKFGLAFGGT
jgi:hypothetical protein